MTSQEASDSRDEPITPEYLFQHYDNLIKDEMGRHETAIAALDTKIDALLQVHFPAVRADIVALQGKSGLWGAVAGAMTGAVPILIALGLRLLGH